MRHQLFKKLTDVMLGRMQTMLLLEHHVKDSSYAFFTHEGVLAVAAVIVADSTELSKSLTERVKSGEVERLFHIFAYPNNDVMTVHAQKVVNGEIEDVQQFRIEYGNPAVYIDTAEMMHEWICNGSRPIGTEWLKRLLSSAKEL